MVVAAGREAVGREGAVDRAGAVEREGAELREGEDALRVERVDAAGGVGFGLAVRP